MKNTVSLTAVAALLAVALAGLPSVTRAVTLPGNTHLGKNSLTKNLGSDNTAIGFGTLNPNAACRAAGAPFSCCTGVGQGICGSDAGCTAAGTPVACCQAPGEGICGNAGSDNTAVGSRALTENTNGLANTAVGSGALFANTTGSTNAAVGASALWGNTMGWDNVAVGYSALSFNTSGHSNSAVGRNALVNNMGNYNNALGNAALAGNDGNYNNALGAAALFACGGSYNNAIGDSALLNNLGGSNNIAIGSHSGSNIVDGSNNIYIGISGPADESNATRIGGIFSATNSGGVAVFIDSLGQLGTTTSSVRFKRDIEDMGDSSRSILKLHPVRFRYKKAIDPSGLEQYGLVAEEVAKVYPHLVVYDGKGQPQTVRYHFVYAMMLNELQKAVREISAQRRQINDQARQIAQLTDQTRQVAVQAHAIETLTARLAQLETVVGTGARAPAVQASYPARRGF